ncbi:MAG: DUF72 domain-containing protein [Spirochaetota bacterium]
MPQIFLGTSGYSYKDWIGPFYPQGMNPLKFLSYYAQFFPFVELNYSYYRQPDPLLTEKFIAQTPPHFLFSIKAHQSLTHQVTTNWQKEAARFKTGVAQLARQNRIAAVLLQFPFSFHYTRENRVYLGNLCTELHNLPLVVEFRNREWQNENVYGEMKERLLGLAVVDTPPLKGLPIPKTVATANISYIRFHGRNARNWWTGDNTTRYDYLYSVEELEEWIPPLLDLSQKARLLLLVFNNHFKGQAVTNAFQMKKLLQEKCNLSSDNII